MWIENEIYGKAECKQINSPHKRLKPLVLYLNKFTILDIQLPDMDGLEVLEMIRKSRIDGKIPVIAMTSFAMSDDRQKMISASCNGYIEKPIDTEKVMSQIEKIIEEKQ